MMFHSLCTSIFCLLITVYLPHTVSFTSSGSVQTFSCEQAPNEDSKTICRQLQSWDAQVRNQAVYSSWSKTSLTTSHHYHQRISYATNGTSNYAPVFYVPQAQDWSQWSKWTSDTSYSSKYAGDVKVRSRSRTVVSRIRCTSGRCGDQQVLRFKLKKQPVSNGYVGNSYYVEQTNSNKPTVLQNYEFGMSVPTSNDNTEQRTTFTYPANQNQESAQSSKTRYRVTIQRTNYQPSATSYYSTSSQNYSPSKTNQSASQQQYPDAQLRFGNGQTTTNFQQPSLQAYSYYHQSSQAQAQSGDHQIYTNVHRNMTRETTFPANSRMQTQIKPDEHQQTSEPKWHTRVLNNQQHAQKLKPQPYPPLHQYQQAFHNSSKMPREMEQSVDPNKHSKYEHEYQQNAESTTIPTRNTSQTSVYECTTLLCLCTYIHGTVRQSKCRTPDGQILQPALRKEYRQLTANERQRFHNALSKLKITGEYSKIAGWHADPKLCGGAHSGPAFLPWHREYIKRFEFALRTVDFTVSLPYWDSTLEGQLQDGKDSCLFEVELMGRFKRAANYTEQSSSRKIREIGQYGRPLRERDIEAFKRSATVEDVLAYTAPKPGCYYKPSWTSLEYSNGNVLLWLGGASFQPSISANDPLFFMHHAFLDKLWEDWRQQNQTTDSRTTAYPPDSINCSSEEHFANSPMRPFDHLRNIDGIGDFYTKNLYRYQERATCPSGKDEECGSSFLFCDRSHRQPHCAAKVRLGGNCIGFENNEKPCISGHCINGVCS